MWANNTSQFVTFAGKENNISPGNKNVSEFAIVKLLQSNLMRSKKIKIHLEGKMTEREVIYPLKNPLHQPLFFETNKLIPKELLPENLVCGVFLKNLRKLDKWSEVECKWRSDKPMSWFDPPCNTVPSPKHQ